MDELNGLVLEIFNLDIEISNSGRKIPPTSALMIARVMDTLHSLDSGDTVEISAAIHKLTGFIAGLRNLLPKQNLMNSGLTAPGFLISTVNAKFDSLDAVAASRTGQLVQGARLPIHRFTSFAPCFGIFA